MLIEKPEVTLEARQTTPDLGWQAELSVSFKRKAGKTVLYHTSHKGPLRVQRPFYPENEVCHLYILHPPGGVVSGDALNTRVSLSEQAHALLTMPGATKIYRSNAPVSVIKQHFFLDDSSTLEWLPPGNIFFPGARAELTSDFHLQPGARLIAQEIFCFGRPVKKEKFNCGHVTSKLRLFIDGMPLLIERLNITGRLDCLAGFPYTSSMLVYPANSELLEKVRYMLLEHPHPCGATLLDTLLIIRLVDHSNLPLEQMLKNLWCLVRPHVTGLKASVPRIWST